MKIALVRQRFQVGGGAARSLEGLMAELVRKGHDVHLFANRWDAARLGGVTFHHVPIIGGLSFLKVLSFAAFSSFQLRRMDFDIIHSFERTLHQDIYRAGDGCHREWLIQRHRAFPWHRPLDAVSPLHRTILALERRIFTPGCSRRVIANSRKTKEEILRHYGFPEDRIAVVYNGVDLDRFHPRNRERLRPSTRRRLGLDPEEFILLFVGSGFERKGLRFLIEGASLVQARRTGLTLKILIAGNGNPRPYLALAEGLGLKGLLQFVGVWPQVEALYAAADLFVLPTLYDPFANVCLEAMAAGLPVITTSQNGASELIEDGRSGLLVKDPLDVEELADRIILMADEVNRHSIGQRGRQVAEGFGMGPSVEGTLKIYRKVFRGNTSGVGIG